MSSGDQDFIELFVEETREHLSGIEEDLLAIEQGAENAPAELIDKVFRAVHTVKGSAGFFEFIKVKQLAHAMESVLGKFRSRELVATPAMISVLLDAADTLRSMVNDLGNSENQVITAFVAQLESFLDSPAAAPGPLPPKIPLPEQTRNAQAPAISPDLHFLAPVTELVTTIALKTMAEVQQTHRTKFLFTLEFDTSKDIFVKDRSESECLEDIGSVAQVIDKKYYEDEGKRFFVMLCATAIDKDMLIQYTALAAEQVSLVASGAIQEGESGTYDLSKVTLSHVADESQIAAAAKPDIGHSDPTPAPQKEMSSPPLATEHKSISAVQENSLRVSIHTLDKLMTLAGEMVLTRNELLQNTSARDMQNILKASQRVNSITSELQEAIMSTRMQPVGVVFSKFRRIVRDLSKQLGKQISLEIEGEDVELDKSIIEAIADPLTHIIRNSVDHGIETPDIRIAAGKAPEGTLTIKASHEAGHVIIAIADDGKGIDPVVIRNKVRKLGLADENQLASLSDRDIIAFIFKPGFSTVEQVTEISGRGVGMDVVQSNLKKVGGNVEIDTITGKGTTLRIKLPLTLAIISSLLVIVEKERYAIPQSNLVELVRVPAADVKRRIEQVGAASVIRLRGALLPLIRVSEILGITRSFYEEQTHQNKPDRRSTIADRRTLSESDKLPAEQRTNVDRRKSPASAVCIVVVAAGDFKYGLIVDSLLDTSEIVVKPLGYHLSQCREYAGATILGDGQVALILDVIGIRRHLETQYNAAISKRAKRLPTSQSPGETQSFLIVENGEGEYFALPQGLISRIEKVKEEAIKITSGKLAVQYRGATLRLFSIDDIVDAKPRKKSDEAYVILFEIGGREAGIIASEIQDIVQIGTDSIDTLTHVQPGIIGSTVIHDSIAVILDMFGIVKASAPEFYRNTLPDLVTGNPPLLLIVEDSPFFMQQMRSFIEDAGYRTICAEDGVKGLATLRNSTEKIDLVLTDIEMPNMNGLDMALAIRQDPALKSIPIIAVTSVSGDKAEQAGKDAGIDEYLIKLERDAVLTACKKHLKQLTLQA